MSWRTPPEPIDESLIKEVYDADVVVVGLGYSGTTAFRGAQEAGASTIGIEFQKEERYTGYGRDIGHLNSKFLKERGVPEVDPIEFYNEWMRRAGNRANGELVMKFAKRSGETFDWFTDVMDEEGFKNMHVAFWPNGNEKFKEEARNGGFILNGYRFWNGTAQFPDPSPMGWPGHPSLPETAKLNQDKAVAEGARAFYGIEAMQLVRTGDRITGVIGKDREGNYYQYNGKKGVILASGDFSANQEMLEELAIDITDLYTPDEKPTRNGGRNGRGIQMGVWEGARLETRPLPTMGGNQIGGMGGYCSFGGVWLDRNGKRFCNEVFGGNEIVGFSGNQTVRGETYTVFDEHCLENELSYAVPAHGGFDVSVGGAVEKLESLFEFAKANPETGKYESAPGPAAPGPGPGGSRKPDVVFYGRTPEELAKNAGLEGKVAETFAQSLHRYNEFCAAGRDEDFGRDPKVLDPLTDMLFMQVSAPAKFGFMLVTVGGLVTDGNQQVLDMNYEKIPGLYATGNCCGRRFGTQYFTPISGVSIGMAMTLGREAGIAAANAE